MIERSFEHRFALKFIGIFVAFTGIIIVILFFTMSGHEIKNYAESIRVFMKSHSDLQSSIMKAYIIEAVLASFLVVFIAVFASHKISGPVYRMQTVLNSLLATLHMRPVVFREHDQLEGIASGFNAMQKGLREQFEAISTAYDELDQKRKGLDNSEQKIKEVETEVKKLAKAIRLFDV